ncbi:MAG: ribonuclease Y [Candidatus Phytoplasma australasiaticum]|nr:ribonuclease Y [Candidatus Phytoplasma australasiaticum]MDV3199825.1 ribonuclease Y [Candidatus Phytoplasma australasiaticum]
MLGTSTKWFLALFIYLPLIIVILGFLYYLIFYYQQKIKRIIQTTKKNAQEKISNAQIIAQEIISKAKQEIHILKKEVEEDLNLRRRIIVNLEEQIIHKEELLNSRTRYLNDKEELLYMKEQKINISQTQIEQMQNKVQNLIIKQQNELENIASLTKEQAKKIIMDEIRKNSQQEIMSYIKSQEEECKFQVKKKANVLLVSAMQQLSRKISSENNVDIVYLDNNELKGRIIGKEGRNIRTFQIITGVDLIIDDIPNTVILSSFDAKRREIARRTLEFLISDGRITPVSIEQTFTKVQDELDNFIQDIGEEAVLEAKIGFLNEELIKLLGSLHFRTSHGQNVLQHSLEVSFLAGKLAAEIGENELLARRAGLLHDIGKSLDYQLEGSHVKIGLDIVMKHKEPLEVIDAVASHHEDQEPSSIIAVLVSIADAISASRPGARRDSLDNYIKRITQLEEIANQIPGVEKSYAIKSGREIRVIVDPKQIDDLAIFTVIQTIKDQIIKNIRYNGSIKITVIREVRLTEISNLSIS